MEKTILEILQKQNPEIDWQNDYLDEIDLWTAGIDDLTNESIKEKVEHYFKKILPKQWRVFNTITEYQKKEKSFELKKYDVGIFLVGFSEVPIILSLLILQPKEIYFIYSPESKSTLPWILKGVVQIDDKLGKMVESAIISMLYSREIKTASDPILTFEQIEDIIKTHNSGQIAVDITGGKKTMIGGAFLSASISEQCDFFYVDFLEYNEQSRRPKHGTEFLNKLLNPKFANEFIKKVTDEGVSREDAIQTMIETFKQSEKKESLL